MSHSKSDSKPPLEVVSILIIRHKTVSKMAERGRTWSKDEIRGLIAAWSDEEIQRELSDVYRNEAVHKKIANELPKAGYSRSSKQCRDKIKQLITVENDSRAELFFVSIAFDGVSFVYESKTVHKQNRRLFSDTIFIRFAQSTLNPCECAYPANPNYPQSALNPD